MQRTVIVIAAMAASVTLCAQDGVERVLLAIEQNNTTLDALRKRTEAEKAGNRTQTALPDPEVEFGYLWGGPGGIGHRKDVTASQQIDLATIGGARHRIVAGKDALADSRLKAERTAILLEAKKLCVDAIYYNALLRQLDRRKRSAQALADRQRRRTDLGDDSRMAYHNVLLDLASVEAEESRCVTERQVVMDGLARLNGGMAVELADTLYPAMALPADFDSWLAAAERQSAALDILKRQVEVGRHQLAVSRAEGLPKLSVGFSGEYASDERYQGVTIGMSIPLWSNKSRVRQARAEVAAAEAEHADARLQLYSELRALFRRQAGLRRVADIYRHALDSTSNVALLHKALAAGSISVVDYILGARVHDEAVARWLEAERQWQRACAQLTAVTL